MAKGKVIHNEDACTVLVEGNKHARPEPSEHIIEFPGGSISVTRTSDDQYWAHIWVNNGQVLDDVHVLSKPGNITSGRIDRDVPGGQIDDLPNPENVTHIAVKISTRPENYPNVYKFGMSN